MSTVDPRIMSAETENHVFRSDRHATSPYELARTAVFYHQPLPEVVSARQKPHNTKAHLSNGYKFYKDTDDNSEVALPECAGLDEVVDYIVAGDYFLSRAVVHHVTKAKREGRLSKEAAFRAHRRAVSYQGPPKGFHQNYEVARKPDDSLYLRSTGRPISRLFCRFHRTKWRWPGRYRQRQRPSGSYAIATS